MATKNYMINDKWLDLDKQNIVELQSVDGVLDSVKLNGEEYGGGGGSSDFSTATVTVSNTTSDMLSVLAVSIRDTPSSAVVPFGTIMADSDRTHTVPLYKGVCSWKMTSADVVVAVSGDISYDNGNIFITGDGTITIS